MLRFQAKSTKQRDIMEEMEEMRTTHSEKVRSGPQMQVFQVMLLTFVPNQSESFHLVELSCVVRWGLDHPMILFLGIPLVGICYRWCLELQL